MKFALLKSLLTQGYVSLVGVVLMPAYLRYVGAEGVGLIGLFVMVQGLLPLLDLGLSAVLSREMSRVRAGLLDDGTAWLKLRSLVSLFSLIGVLVVIAMIGAAEDLTKSWLKIGVLTDSEVEYCLVAMALAAVLRWIAGTYRAALVGLDEQRWLNASALAFATIKHVGVLLLLAWGSPTAFAYFSYQVATGFLELMVLRHAFSRSLPMPNPCPPFRWLAGLREAWALAGAMTFLSIIWILFNQLDKLVLSRVLTLADYGYFAIATSLAGSVANLISPLTQVLQPRFTVLAAQERTAELIGLYRVASQGSAALFASVGGSAALLAPLLLYAWIGDPNVVARVAPTLFWYGISSALVGMLSLPFMLQFAFGELSLHVRGNILLCIFGLPALAFAAATFGAVGAGITLCSMRILFLLFWIPRVHRRFIPAMSSRWLRTDVLPAAFAVTGLLLLAARFVPTPDNRLVAGLLAVLLGLAALTAGLASGSHTREAVRRWLEGVR